MARFPGTEKSSNRAGLRPGQLVRCLRMRANAALGLADRRGLVLQVRLANARVLFGLQGPTHWLANEQLVAEDAAPDAELALLARVMVALRAERLDFDEGELLLASQGLPAAALDEARALLGPRLLSLELRPEGVHELGIRLRLEGWTGPGPATA
ncbi:MAG TPA: hypothetical protein VFY71_05770 [Planctomycetota bacterium]|nr:hypothetical protein [Planctomycetota bacterium]